MGFSSFSLPVTWTIDITFTLGFLTFYMADREPFSNYDSITALWEPSVVYGIKEEILNPVFKIVSAKLDCLPFFRLNCLCCCFALLLRSPPVKILSIFCWHAFTVSLLNKCDFDFVKKGLTVLNMNLLQSLPLTLSIASSLWEPLH